jgi:glycosyltransferase involved in cell wall biosynthesis
MRTVGISHRTRYWQQYCFSHPPEGHRYARMPDIPWHAAGIRWEVLANTKYFLPLRVPDLFHTYNAVVANPRPWVVEVESYLPRFQGMDQRHPFYRWALRRLAGDHCRGLVFTSRNAMDLNREKLVAAGVDEGRMTVIYRAVERYAPLARDPERPTVLFAGNGFYRKGGTELLKAFLRMGATDLRLEIISTLEVDWGIFPSTEEVAWVRRTIAEHPRITLHSRLPHAALIARMRAADIFVSTTFADPFNNTVLEAMGAHLPVICSGVGALPEVVEHGRNAWVVPVKDRKRELITEELADRLKTLAGDAAMRSRMGAESAAIARERFDITVRNGALAQLYGRALR